MKDLGIRAEYADSAGMAIREGSLGVVGQIREQSAETPESGLVEQLGHISFYTSWYGHHP